MKKWTVLLLALTLLAACAPLACAQSADGGTLVVYFSAQSHTKAVAETIAETLGADVFVIQPAVPYPEDDLDWTNPDSRVCKEHEDPDRQVELVSTEVPGWENYDTVFVGYPIWWQHASWVMDGFVTANDFTGKRVIPFCTSQASGFGESGEVLAKTAGTGDWVEGMRFYENCDKQEVVDWVNGLSL